MFNINVNDFLKIFDESSFDLVQFNFYTLVRAGVLRKELSISNKLFCKFVRECWPLDSNLIIKISRSSEELPFDTCDIIIDVLTFSLVDVSKGISDFNYWLEEEEA